MRRAGQLSTGLIVGLAIAAVGCGYRPLVARVPGGGERIAVPPVENRTSYAGLAGPLAGALRRALARDGLEVVGAGQGAPRLEVVLQRVDGGPGMLGTSGERLVPVDLRWEVTAEAAVVGADGVRAGPTEVRVDGRSMAGGGATAEEALGDRARQSLMEELAREIVRVLFHE
jgi:hypothetical protein